LARHTSQARLDEAEALAHMHGLADFLEEPIPLFHDRDRLPLFAINRGRVGENGVEMNNERRTELLDSGGYSSLMSYAKENVFGTHVPSLVLF
jgi:hypothetical protein